MGRQETCSSSRILSGILATLALFFLCKTFSGLPEFGFVIDNAIMSPIEGLKLTLEHVAGSSPPTLTATVSNENSYPVSILEYESPLDKLVLPIGRLEITPANAGAPLELPRIAVRRVWPPTRDQLITIEPGESIKNHIVLKENIVPPQDLQGLVVMELKGKWQAVWSKRKVDIDQPSLDNPYFSPDTESGEYSSGKVEIKF